MALDASIGMSDGKRRDANVAKKERRHAQPAPQANEEPERAGTHGTEHADGDWAEDTPALVVGVPRVQAIEERHEEADANQAQADDGFVEEEVVRGTKAQ